MSNVNKDKEFINVTCCACDTLFNITYGHYRKNKQGPFYCKSCAQKIRANATKASWYNLTDRERAQRKLAMIRGGHPIKDMTPEAKLRWKEKISESRRSIELETMSDDKKRIFGDQWSKLSPSERRKFKVDVKCKDCNKVFQISYGQYMFNRGKNLDYYWRCRECRYKYHALVMSERNHFNNLSDESKQRKVDNHIKWYQSLSYEEKSNFIKKRLSNSNGNNNLHKRFESYFTNSYISNDYYYYKEEIIIRDNLSKVWDYTIYSKDTNKLQMVVDLDGAYYHADNCDYNGIQSREDYDVSRFILIPDGVKHHIIYELKFTESFENMIKQLMLNYDEFVQSQFDLCRMIPFPYAAYSNNELIKSWNDLCNLASNVSDYRKEKYYIKSLKGSGIGMRIVNHFHHSIYSANRSGRISPYDAWHDDELLMKVIKNRIIYVNIINPNKILQGFNISKIAQKVSVFSPSRAKLLIHKYLNEFDTIFDPFSGFSGRMLGAVSLGKHYIGQDISSIHVKESNEIIEYLSLENKATISQQNILQSFGTYDCLFTCPPYSDKEQWYDVPIDTRSCDDWIDLCLKRFKCKKYLFVIDNTEKYKNHIVDEITNLSHMGLNKEKIILIR